MSTDGGTRRAECGHRLLFEIIHEDADLLVVHKPADLVCHPTKGDEYSSLISRARIYLQASPDGSPTNPEMAGEEKLALTPALSPRQREKWLPRLDKMWPRCRFREAMREWLKELSLRVRSPAPRRHPPSPI